MLDTTAELLRAAGPQAATSRAIADAAGENLGAITYYFGSKEQLVAESMVAVARTLIEPVVAELADRDADPVQKLVGSIQLLYGILDANRHQLPGYLHSLAAAATNKTVRHGIQALHRSLASVLAEAIGDQRSRGLLPGWIDPEPMAQLIVATVNGVIVAAATDPERTDEVAAGAQFAQLLLAARTPPSD